MSLEQMLPEQMSQEQILSLYVVILLQAMAMRQTAVLMEETSPEVVKIQLGELKPGSGATIRSQHLASFFTCH
jgi:hypothetical protein